MKFGLKTAVVQAPQEKKSRFKEDTDFATCDWGNRYYKQMITGNRPSVTITENSVVVLQTSTWDQHRAQFKNSPGRFKNTEIFGFYHRRQKANSSSMELDPSSTITYVAVGESAKNYGRTKNMTDEIKYVYNSYWGAVVCSQLIRLFPNGSNNIVLALAQPTKSYGQREMMVHATLGKHKVVTTDGRTIDFKVVEVLPWDEPVGGVIRWTETEEYLYNKYSLSAGDMILVVDIGGGVSSFTRVQVEYDNLNKMMLMPVYDQQQSPSVPMGIRNVMDKFKELLKSSHPRFSTLKEKEITDRMLEQGIREGKIDLKGQPVEVREQLQFAEAELLDLMENRYRNDLGNGDPFKVIITTGGGMHTYHNRLNTELFDHGAVESSGPLLNIHLANLIGGDEIFRQWLQREARKNG